MAFTKQYQREEEQTTAEASGGRWMRGFKEGDTVLRILQEPHTWESFWEHYNPTPGMYPFPCTGERNTCPGCTSENPKMRSASRKVPINCLHNGYVDVFKFPKRVADKLALRAERIGTILDRDYLIRRIGMDKNTDYDVEGGDKSPIDVNDYELHDIEQMLQQAYDENAPQVEVAKEDFVINTGTETTESRAERIRAKTESLRRQQSERGPDPENPPTKPQGESHPSSEEKAIQETKLRSMTPAELRQLWDAEMSESIPRKLSDTDEIVDWMLTQI